MAERAEKYRLYQEFAENRERSVLRRVIPFAVTFGSGLPAAIGIAANEEVILKFIEDHPEINVPIVGYTVLLGITGIGAFIQYLDIVRAESPNGRLAQEIAQVEGRNPKSPQEIKQEIQRVSATVKLAGNISPTPGNLFDLSLNHHLARRRAVKHPEVLEERAISDRKIRKWSVKSVEKDWLGYPQDPQRITDALILADRRWEEICSDETRPKYKRRYGALMREEIQKKLTQHLAGLEEDESRRAFLRYQQMTSRERSDEFRRLVGQFPIRQDFEAQAIHQQRGESEEKRILFAQIRGLLATTPTTRAFQEILLRGLSVNYDIGLSKNQPLEDEEFKAIGLEEDVKLDIFSEKDSKNAERRLYGLIKKRHRALRNLYLRPLYYDEYDVPNRVKRLVLNSRKTIAACINLGIDVVVFKLLPYPTSDLERSWQWQYKAKYNEKLK